MQTMRSMKTETPSPSPPPFMLDSTSLCPSCARRERLHRNSRVRRCLAGPLAVVSAGEPLCSHRLPGCLLRSQRWSVYLYITRGARMAETRGCLFPLEPGYWAAIEVLSFSIHWARRQDDPQVGSLFAKAWRLGPTASEDSGPAAEMPSRGPASSRAEAFH